MPWMVPRLLKNLISGPVTRKYPFEKRAPFPDVRGLVVMDQSRCDLCGDCVRLCPSEALTLELEQCTLTYNPFRCIYCRLCVESCLHQALRAQSHTAPAATEKSTTRWQMTGRPLTSG